MKSRLLLLLFLACSGWPMQTKAQDIFRDPDISADSEMSLANSRIGTSGYLIAQEFFHAPENSDSIILVPLGSKMRLIKTSLTGKKFVPIAYFYDVTLDGKLDTVVCEGSEVMGIKGEDPDQRVFNYQKVFFSNENPKKEYKLGGKLWEAYQSGQIIEGLPEDVLTDFLLSSIYTQPSKTETTLGNSYIFHDFDNSWVVTTRNGKVTYIAKTPLN